MREILFRAKLKDWKTNPNHNIWVEGFYLKKQETTYCFAEDYEEYPVKTLHFIAEERMTDWGLPNDFRLYEIDPETVGQYTGLQDKNGAKIFEGDIVKSGNLIGVVRFGEYGYNGDRHLGFYIDWSKVSNPYNILRQDLMFWVNDDLEVIGNIYDNPELLEVELCFY